MESSQRATVGGSACGTNAPVLLLCFSLLQSDWESRVGKDEMRATRGAETDGTVGMSLRSRIAWKSAQIAALALAGVLILTRYGLQSLCISVAGLLVGAVIVSGVSSHIQRPLVRRKVSLAFLPTH